MSIQLYFIQFLYNIIVFQINNLNMDESEATQHSNVNITGYAAKTLSQLTQKMAPTTTLYL